MKRRAKKAPIYFIAVRRVEQVRDYRHTSRSWKEDKIMSDLSGHPRSIGKVMNYSWSFEKNVSYRPNYPWETSGS